MRVRAKISRIVAIFTVVVFTYSAVQFCVAGICGSFSLFSQLGEMAFSQSSPVESLVPSCHQQSEHQKEKVQIYSLDCCDFHLPAELTFVQPQRIGVEKQNINYFSILSYLLDNHNPQRTYALLFSKRGVTSPPVRYSHGIRLHLLDQTFLN